MQHERLNDMPIWVKWTMTFIERLGFPVLVCFWLAYQQFVSGKEQSASGRETIKAIQEFKEVMVRLADTVERQNKILTKRSRDD